MLLDRGCTDEAQAAIDRLAAARAGSLAIGEMALLRLRALMADARGDEAGYRPFRDSYRVDGEIARLRGTHRGGRSDGVMRFVTPATAVT